MLVPVRSTYDNFELEVCYGRGNLGYICEVYMGLYLEVGVYRLYSICEGAFDWKGSCYRKSGWY